MEFILPKPVAVGIIAAGVLTIVIHTAARRMGFSCGKAWWLLDLAASAGIGVAAADLLGESRAAGAVEWAGYWLVWMACYGAWQSPVGEEPEAEERPQPRTGSVRGRPLRGSR